MSQFWDDLNEDLKDPEFRAAYERMAAELAAERQPVQDLVRYVTSCYADHVLPWADGGWIDAQPEETTP